MIYCMSQKPCFIFLWHAVWPYLDLIRSTLFLAYFSVVNIFVLLKLEMNTQFLAAYLAMYLMPDIRYGSFRFILCNPKYVFFSSSVEDHEFQARLKVHHDEMKKVAEDSDDIFVRKAWGLPLHK